MKSRVEQMQDFIGTISLTEQLSDQRGLLKLSQLQGADATFALDVYLGMDRIDIWAKLHTDPTFSGAINWLGSRKQQVLEKCPQLVEYWACFDRAQSYDFVVNIGRMLDAHARITDIERLAVLQGQHLELYPALRDSFQKAMRLGADTYLALSPSWIGTEHSALRQHALANGWTPDMLPAMCRMNVHRESAGSWLPNIAYAYTLMLLDEHLGGTLGRDSYDQRWQLPEWAIRFHRLANPLDTVAARRVLAHMDLSRRPYTIVEPTTDWGSAQVKMKVETACADDVARVASMVDIYMELGLGKVLAQHLTQQSLMAQPSGSMGPVKPMESLALPELDTPT